MKRNKNWTEHLIPLEQYPQKKENINIILKVHDYGNGISQKIVDKIFQPFFTTKPTGQGTGLGLSLAYDIIKAHGGEITVETKENEGSAFIIQLPLARHLTEMNFKIILNKFLSSTLLIATIIAVPIYPEFGHTQ